MESGFVPMILLLVVLFILGLCCKPIRKGLGVVLIVAGALACVTCFGIPIGLLSIFFGVVFLSI